MSVRGTMFEITVATLSYFVRISSPIRWPLIIGIIGGCIVVVSIILLILAKQIKKTGQKARK
jgi:uncharacterized integral membrane protein